MKYEYRLKGYEKQWTPTLFGEHSAKYNAIPAGDYIFQIRATDEKGHWGEDITEIEVHISPHFYKTVWFYLLLTLLISITVYYLHHRKTRLYLQQKKYLEKEVQLRTQELAQQSRKMEAMAKHIDELEIAKTSKDSQFMEKAFRFMQQNYTDSNYNLERFIKDMGYSKTLVNEKLQSLTGQSIGAFMKSYRLNTAKKMLQESPNVSISEVAYAVGFNDPKYFTKCFKEQFGVLPSETRG